MNYQSDSANTDTLKSNASIAYQDGFYLVMTDAELVSKHGCLHEAQWIASILQKDQ